MKSQEIIHHNGLDSQPKRDFIALEAKLSIEIIWGEKHKRNRTHIADVMRSPGNDGELSLGLMFSLGIISSRQEVIAISPCPRGLLDPDANERIIIELASDIKFDAQNFSLAQMRHAGCGICGNIQALPGAKSLNKASAMVAPEIFAACLALLKPSQKIFSKTGGTHAAALFDLSANLMALYEDVGRHNALDKLIGSFLKQEGMPLTQHILLMSSRGSFELLQKAHMAQIPIVAVVGAVSSLALSYADHACITLVGFLRGSSFNIYTHPHRIDLRL